ncbi:MAG: cyclic nucleotide-binding domain-containing protein, partial [Candidatus Delongbacteria bacterium]|nr:cyclic nucleotide-binding domain-containing protein [Candidatus Delongbacteria bacterium]
IGSEPRLKKTPFAFGGAMVIHRNLMRIVPFDPEITRGEDTDYVINARMFGFNFYLDNTLAIKHLPPPKKHPVWKRFREDIYRFLYDKSKFDTQSPQTNLRMITPEEFDPYPGEFMKKDLGDKIFKTNIILALNYLADGDVEACKETINNIYLARYEAIPHNNTFDAYLEFQKKWRKFLEHTREFGNTLKNIILEGMVISFDKYQYEVKKIKEKAKGLDNFNIDDIELFKGFSKKELRRLFFIAEIKNYEKDEYIFHDDEIDTNVYIVLRGKLLVTKKQLSTGEYITIAKLEQGEHFNETSIFTEQIHRVSVVTTTAVDLMILTKEKAQAILKEDCSLSAKIYRILAKKLSERLVDTTQKFSETKEQTTDISDSMQKKED